MRCAALLGVSPVQSVAGQQTGTAEVTQRPPEEMGVQGEGEGRWVKQLLGAAGAAAEGNLT